MRRYLEKFLFFLVVNKILLAMRDKFTVLRMFHATGNFNCHCFMPVLSLTTTPIARLYVNYVLVYWFA